MTLRSYFTEHTGFGVMATADSDGKVDAAVYARPHFVDENTVAFIMADRLTHANLQTNPHATYLFKEKTLHRNCVSHSSISKSICSI